MTRRDLLDAEVTLDGHPAVICGVRNDFATVARLDGHGQFDWSWSAAERIVERGGEFRS